MPTNRELASLVDALCDGTMTANDVARLDAALKSDAAARQYYNNYLFLHGELYSQHAAGSWQGLEVAREGPEGRRSVNTTSLRRSRLAIAAALVGVAAVSSWLTFSLSPRSSRATTAPAASKLTLVNSVARVTATRNCAWAEGTDVGYGARLASGQRLNLSTGLVEITFDDGAVVVLEGPATFEVETSGRALLHQGRLAAVVPERARGFELETSRLNVVDLGTEFGVMAESEGTTEVHVFKGLVKAHVLDAAGQQIRTVELNTSEAARIEFAVSTVARIPARDDEFVRTLSVVVGPHDGLYAYDGFNYPAGPLDEQNGGFGWAGPWSTVEADASSYSATNGVMPDSLPFDNLIPIGNHAAQTAQQNRIRRVLSTSLGGVFDAAGLIENQDGARLIGRDDTTIYLSFLQRVSKLNDVFYGFELHRGDGNGNRVLCIGNGVDGTGYGVTSNVNTYGPANFPSLGPENTETNFFVARITYGLANRDKVEVFRNPVSFLNESECKVNAELKGNFAFDRISFGNFNGTKVHEIDEIRVGTTFRSVTGRRGRGPDRLTPRVAASAWRRGQTVTWKQMVPLFALDWISAAAR